MTKNQRRLTLTVEEAGDLLGVGRSTAYELVRSGEIPSIRLRRRIVVPVAHLSKRLCLTPAEILHLAYPAETEQPACATSRVESATRPNALF